MPYGFISLDTDTYTTTYDPENDSSIVQASNGTYFVVSKPMDSPETESPETE